MDNTTTARGLDDCPKFLKGRDPFGAAQQSQQRGCELVADRGVLLHEMIHQYLIERGESPKHEHEPWCREIMQLHRAITRKAIWATPESVGKELGPDGKRKSTRFQKACPETGMESIPRKDLSRWPHSCGLELGPL